MPLNYWLKPEDDDDDFDYEDEHVEMESDKDEYEEDDLDEDLPLKTGHEPSRSEGAVRPPQGEQSHEPEHGGHEHHEHHHEIPEAAEAPSQLSLMEPPVKRLAKPARQEKGCPRPKPAGARRGGARSQATRCSSSG